MRVHQCMSLRLAKNALWAGSYAFVTASPHYLAGVRDSERGGFGVLLKQGHLRLTSPLRCSNLGILKILQAAEAPIATLRRNHASRRKSWNATQRFFPWFFTAGDHAKLSAGSSW